MQQQVAARVLRHPAYAGCALAGAREALRAWAVQADGVLAGLAQEAGALAALEAMQRFAVRSALPFYTDAGLFTFPWLERAVMRQCASLRPPATALPPVHGSASAVLRRLAAVHEALEDVMRADEEGRQAVCRGVLAACAAAMLSSHMGAGAARAHLERRCLVRGRHSLDRAACGAPCQGMQSGMALLTCSCSACRAPLPPAPASARW